LELLNRDAPALCRGPPARTRLDRSRSAAPAARGGLAGLSRDPLHGNVQDFRRLDADALGREQPRARLILTTDRQFPRGDPATIGRLVTALDDLLAAEPDLVTALFLKPA
jgi:hypothetical protein